MLLVHDHSKIVGWNLRCSSALKTVDGYYTEDSSSQPKKQGQERESFNSAPLTTSVVTTKRHAAPRPRTAAVLTIEPVHKGSENSGPASGEDYTLKC
jgi:hypothetical protein